MIVRSRFFIILIKCMKGHKSPVLLFIAPPSGALVVGQFQDPVPSVTHRFGCSNLLYAVFKCPKLNLAVSRGSVEVSRESGKVSRSQ